MPDELVPVENHEAELMTVTEEVTTVSLTLLTCTLGRLEPLERLLRSLTAQTSRDFEIIIVDQNPEGFLTPILEQFTALPIVHLRSLPGLSKARNVGLARSSGRFIGFPDDDVWYRPTLVAEVVHAFAMFPEISIVTGRSIDPEGHAVTVSLAGQSSISRENVFEAGNSNTIFLDRNLAQSLKFDEGLGLGAVSDFQSGEETDFLLRALARGATGMYIPGLTIFHDPIDHHAPVDERARRTEAYARGFGYILRRYRYPRAYVFGKVARASLRGAWCVANGDLAGARMKAVWVRGVLHGYCAAQ